MSSSVLPGHLIYSVTFNSPGLYSDLNFHRTDSKGKHPHTRSTCVMLEDGQGGLGGPGEDISSLSFFPDLPFLPACSCLQAAWADCGAPSLYIFINTNTFINTYILLTTKSQCCRGLCLSVLWLGSQPA